MTSWKNFVFGLALALGATLGAQASGTGGIAWDKAPGKINDNASLQDGVKIFVNYCLNCHSAAYMRFNRLKDIGLTDIGVNENNITQKLKRATKKLEQEYKNRQI